MNTERSSERSTIMDMQAHCASPGMCVQREECIRGECRGLGEMVRVHGLDDSYTRYASSLCFTRNVVYRGRSVLGENVEGWGR